MKLKILFILTLISCTSWCSAQEILYYCSKESGRFQAYKKDLATEEIITLSNDDSYNYWWVEPSPDHTSLVMMRSPTGFGINDQFDYEHSEMITSDVDGENVKVIIEEGQFGWNAFGNPHWHPSKDRILMLAEPDNMFFLFTINSDGTNPTQLTDEFTIDPSWSSDGSQIVYIGINSDPTFPPSFDDFEVFTANYDFDNNVVSEPKQLTDDERRDQDPAFSPNDEFITFSSGNTSLFFADIIQIQSDGENRIALVEDGTTNGGPVNWGSNNKIYYHNVNVFVTPFTAKEYDVENNSNLDLFPETNTGIISPYYIDLDKIVGQVSTETQKEYFIYPNPLINGNIINITVESLNDESLLKIFNIDGSLVRKEKIKQAETFISVQDLSNGVYTFQILQGESIINKRIVIQR